MAPPAPSPSPAPSPAASGQGFPLAGLFVLMAAAATLAGILAPLTQQERLLPVAGPAMAIGGGVLALVGGGLGLAMHYGWRGLVTGGLLGTLIGALAGALTALPPKALFPSLLAAALGSVLIVGVAVVARRAGKDSPL